MISIKQQFFTLVPKLPYRFGAGAFEGVVGHATASYAPAVNEIAYMQRRWVEWDKAGRDPNKTPPFVHFFVDWTGSYYTADINYKSYGAGSVANQRYVHVELCQTRDPIQFKQSYVNYVETLAWVLKQKALGVSWGVTLVTHHWVTLNLADSTHTDPTGYLAEWGMTFDQVVRDVILAYDGKFTLEETDEDMNLTLDQWERLFAAFQGYYSGGLLGDYKYVQSAYDKTLTKTQFDLATFEIQVNKDKSAGIIT